MRTFYFKIELRKYPKILNKITSLLRGKKDTSRKSGFHPILEFFQRSIGKWEDKIFKKLNDKNFTKSEKDIISFMCGI